MKYTYPKYSPEKSRENLREFHIDQKGGVQFTRWQRWVNRYNGDFHYQTKVNMIASMATGFIVGTGLVVLAIKIVLLIVENKDVFKSLLP